MGGWKDGGIAKDGVAAIGGGGGGAAYMAGCIKGRRVGRGVGYASMGVDGPGIGKGFGG